MNVLLFVFFLFFTLFCSLCQGKGGTDFWEYKEIEDFIFEMDTEVSTMIMLNLPDWDVAIEDYEQICSMIILTSIPFFSRTKDDGERASYANTVKVAESQTQQIGGGLNLFRRN